MKNTTARFTFCFFLIGLVEVALRTPVFAAPVRENQVTVLEKEGRVEAARAGATAWTAAQTNQILRVADRVRTGERSRATLHLLDQSTLRMFELSEFLIEPLPDNPDKPVFSLSQGLLYFFHRDKPVDVQFKTRTATAAVRGTEFHLAVADNGRTVLTMFDGEVDLSNSFGTIQLKSGEQGVVEPGRAPVKSPMIDAINLIQWCLYYPGVLDADELRFDASELAMLRDSVAAYRAGDLLAALAVYPGGRQPVSEAEKTFYAGLLLGVGKVEQAEILLPASGPIAGALRALIAAVKNIPATNTILISTNSATEALVRSYQLQAQSKLPEALRAAEASVALAPQFGFGWARVAELEFSFGHTKLALAALEKSLALAPRNAGAVTLRGFALAAQNQIREAMAEFDRAIELDGALGNAWLGRGLCRIRRGDVSGGRADLQVAATLEPQRALFRSYLGKAWSELGNPARAARELALAKERDANDPTAWLYSALLLEQGNRVNEAVKELEQAQALNDNRRIYRSRLLLDQDRAVSGANLANIYRDEGMSDVSLREAGNALSADYANGAAHQFLSDSYTALQDPQQVNLRYETPAVAEHLLANLLSPVGGSSLSRLVSQQEYSQMFEHNRVGLVTDSEYLTRGVWSVNAAQFGVVNGTSYALEGSYHTDPGTRPNDDLAEHSWAARIQHQVSAQDSLYVEVSDSVSRTGDVTPYYDNTDANPTLRTQDAVGPTVVAGWHHEWSPQSHTLFLAAYLHSDLTVNDPGGNSATVALQTNLTGIVSVLPIFFMQAYLGQLDIFSGEIQQIFQSERHTIIAGVMFQSGTFHTQNFQDNPDRLGFLFGSLPVQENVSSGFDRVKGYLYHRWELTDSFRLVGGLTYDWMRFPADFRSAPITDASQKESRWSPKAGVVWTPLAGTTVRAAYAEAVAGTSFDQSFQLEPTEVAGINQSFRSIIPEAVAGANAGAFFDIAGLSLEQRVGRGTYVALSAGWLGSQVNREIGAFVVSADPSDTFHPGSTPQRLHYVEESVGADLHQLLGSEWAFNAGYHLSRSELNSRFSDVAPGTFVSPPLEAQTRTEGVLQRLSLGLNYNHHSGFFGAAQGEWWGQANRQDGSVSPGDNFWQGNLFAGWRSPRRKAEFTVGVMNFTGQDYHLSPINYLLEPARSRTFFFRLRLNL